MKQKKFLVFIACCFMVVTCKDGLDSSQLPIGEVVNIFELKYEEVKSITLNDQLFKFAIKDIDDQVTENCSLVDFIDPVEVPKKIRIHVDLKLEYKNQKREIKVSSGTCGALQYFNDGTDVQRIENLISELKAAINENYFEQEFPEYFGEGTLIKNTSYRINIAKTYPYLPSLKQSPTDDMYKFIFIITDYKK